MNVAAPSSPQRRRADPRLLALGGITTLLGLLMMGMFLIARFDPRWRDPVVYTTTGSDSGPLVLRAALESFGLDDMEDVANRRGLRAEQVVMPIADFVASRSDELPAIAVVGRPPNLDYWLVWRRDSGSFVVMNPRVRIQRRTAGELATDLYEHEMRIPSARVSGPYRATPGSAETTIRGAVLLILRKR